MLWAVLSACAPHERSARDGVAARLDPEGTCARACATRAAPRCSSDECARGCRFVLDRLVEHEGDRVISCVAAARAPCDDALFADCAVRIGEHADGGPPAPNPPDDE